MSSGGNAIVHQIYRKPGVDTPCDTCRDWRAMVQKRIACIVRQVQESTTIRNYY